jgi:tRNA-specific 2-thiouridylase
MSIPSARLAVLLSGGVDSAVAAARIRRSRPGVVGVHLLLGCGSGRGCGGSDSPRAAELVARELGLPFLVLDLRREFERRVVAPFLRGRLVGRTRNPCIECNARLRFGLAVERLRALGIEGFVTGHYARVDPDGGLRRAKALENDQSYALAAVPAERLSSFEFPLGELRKDEVRQEARRLGLSSADRPSSQDLCFAAGRSVAELVEARYPHRCRSGQILDREGRILGTHDGIHCFTVGQRRGFGSIPGGPAYVTRIDPRAARIFVGGPSEARRLVFEVARAVWFPGERPDEGAFRGAVMTRYRSELHPARVFPRGERRAIVAVDPPGAIASPGQRAVWYRGERVAGSGEIV